VTLLVIQNVYEIVFYLYKIINSQIMNGFVPNIFIDYILPQDFRLFGLILLTYFYYMIFLLTTTNNHSNKNNN